MDHINFASRERPELQRDAALNWLQSVTAACTPESIASGTPEPRTDAPEDLETYWRDVDSTLTPANRDFVRRAAAGIYAHPDGLVRDHLADQLERAFDLARESRGRNGAEEPEKPEQTEEAPDAPPQAGGANGEQAGPGDAAQQAQENSPENPQANASQESQPNSPPQLQPSAAADGTEQAAQPEQATGERERGAQPQTGKASPPKPSVWRRIADFFSGAGEAGAESQPGVPSPAPPQPEPQPEPQAPTRRRVLPMGCAGHEEQTEQQTASAMKEEWNGVGRPQVTRSYEDVKDQQSDLPPVTERHDPATGGGAGSNTTNIGGMEIHRHIDRGHHSTPMRRPSGAADSGDIPTQWERWASDRQVFSSTRPGGTILIDCSGSMNWDWKQLRQAISELPAVKIALYSGEGGKGRLCVVAENGRWADPQGHEMLGGNEVDLEALQWLAAQRGPRVWLSDGQICGGQVGRMGEGPGARRAADIAAAKRIVRADTTDSAVRFLRTHGARTTKGTHAARSRDFIPSQWADRSGVGW